MELIADALLVAGALGAGFYCFVLSRRLTRFNDLESGMGGAVAVLSAQVDDMTRTLSAAQRSAGASTESLAELTARAESVAKRLELMVASLHDIPHDPDSQSLRRTTDAVHEDARGQPVPRVIASGGSDAPDDPDEDDSPEPVFARRSSGAA
ncbi:hypothetical protein [Litorisediminicola beolgyonensis]|uniref:Uncharacterized protein n=1 Tax=Litorisediminicola beolgyonensis TaxID=1173614 RepID=A0ABW3ZLV0_9RHOB